MQPIVIKLYTDKGDHINSVVDPIVTRFRCDGIFDDHFIFIANLVLNENRSTFSQISTGED